MVTLDGHTEAVRCVRMSRAQIATAQRIMLSCSGMRCSWEMRPGN